jgi:hypothetical protein
MTPKHAPSPDSHCGSLGACAGLCGPGARPPSGVGARPPARPPACPSARPRARPPARLLACLPAHLRAAGWTSAAS